MKISNFEMVGDFMEAFGQEVLYMPSMPDTNLAALRLDLINEEVQELRDAFGIDLDECFNEVHRSNMTKLGEDGRPLYREDGKVMKGPNYEDPNLEQFLV